MRCILSQDKLGINPRGDRGCDYLLPSLLNKPSAVRAELGLPRSPKPINCNRIEIPRFITLVFVTLPNSVGLSLLFSADLKKGGGGYSSADTIAWCRGAEPRPIPHARVPTRSCSHPGKT